MRKYFDTVWSTSGRLLAGAQVRVLSYPAGAPVPLFSDAAGTVSLGNPVTTDSFGRFEFYVADGRYSLNVQHSGVYLYQIDDVLISESGSATGAWTFSDVDPVSTQGTTGSVWFNRTNGTIWERLDTGWAVQATVNTGVNNPPPNVITTLTIVQGNNQAATVSTAVGVAPTVVVKDNGVAVGAGRAVTFTVASGGGAVVGGSAVTDANGQAAPQSWTVGAAAGTNTLQAYTANATPITFTATAIAAARVPTTLTVQSGTGQSGTVSTALAAVFSLKVFDQFGSPLQNAQVDCIPPSGGSSVPTSALSDAQGITNFVGTLGPSPGVQTFTFRLAANVGVTQAITVTANVGTVVTPPTVVTDGAWMPLEQWATIGINTSGQVINPGTGTVQTFQLTNTGLPTNTYAATVGLWFAQSDADGASSATCDAENYQLDVMRRWSNGNIKHAILTIRGNLPQNVARTITVSRGTPPTRTALTRSALETAVGTANKNKVQCGAFGSAVDLSAILASGYIRTFVAGPEMIECNYGAAVGGGTDLWVYFHVRYYADGRTWVRAIVENGFLDDGAGGTGSASWVTRSYVPTVTLAGTVVYNNGGSALSHTVGARWKREAWIDVDGSLWNSGNGAAVVAKHDGAYLQRTKAVPNYGMSPGTVSAATLAGTTQVVSGGDYVTTLAGLPQTDTPMSNGVYETNFSAYGFAQYIGVLPNWDVLYVKTGDVRAWRGMQAMESMLNSYSIAYRKRSNQTVPRPSDFTNWSIYGPAQGGADAWAPGPLAWEYNHHPSAGYLSYLLTGEYWHLETMAFNSSMCYLVPTSLNGSGVNKIMSRQSRGAAWAMRTVSQYVAIAPDADLANGGSAGHTEIAGDYQLLLSNNVDHWTTVKATAGNTGYFFEPNIGGQGTGTLPSWMHHFWMVSLGQGSEIEPLASMTNYITLRDHLYKAIVGLLGGATGSDYDAGRAVVGPWAGVQIAASSNPDASTWYTNWPAVYAATRAYSLADGVLGPSWTGTTPATSMLGTSGGSPTAASTGYWGQILGAISYAVDHGATNAQAAFDRLRGLSNWSSIVNSQAIRWEDASMWAMTPRNYDPYYSLPYTLPSAGQLKSVNLNALSPLNPCPGNNCWYSFNDKQNGSWVNWCAGVYAPEYSIYGAMIMWGGGHQGYDGIEAYLFDFTTGMWSVLGGNDNPPTSFVNLIDPLWSDYTYNGSTFVPPAHTYGSPVYVPPQWAGNSKGSYVVTYYEGPLNDAGAPGGYAPHALDLATGKWSRFTTNIGTTPGSGKFGCAVVDTRRGMLYAAYNSYAIGNYRCDLTQGTKTLVSWPNAMTGEYGTAVYVPEKDMIVSIWVDLPTSFAPTLGVYLQDCSSGVADPTTGMSYHQIGFPSYNALTFTAADGTTQGGKGAGFDYCPETDTFYWYCGYGTRTVHKIKPPAGSWKTGDWTYIGTETMGGETPATVLEVKPGAQGAQAFGKWRYNRGLKCFMWIGGGTASRNSLDGAVQLYRPLGVS